MAASARRSTATESDLKARPFKPSRRAAVLVCAALASFSLGMAKAGPAAAWTKSFVVEWYEPAFYYGGKGPGDGAPGTDCPAGTIPEVDWHKVLKTSYRSDADIDWLMDAERHIRGSFEGIRGPNKENVYLLPWSVPDGGTQPVTGNIAYGFDLDGNKHNGFVSPNGKTTGIDNNYYRAMGCLMARRAPPRSSTQSKYDNDRMREGEYTILITASGSGADWRNDPNVKVAFYTGKDKIVRDANGDIARDYSFRINPDKRWQSVVAAHTVNGAIEVTEPTEIITHTLGRGVRPLDFQKGRMKLQIKDDGSLEGLIGGYRNIDDYYQEWAQGGAIFELVLHINVPNSWYALHKYADGIPDPKTGKFTAISTAWAIYAQPAIVVSPDASEPVTEARLYDGEPMIPTDVRRLRGGLPTGSRWVEVPHPATATLAPAAPEKVAVNTTTPQ